MKIRNGFVSNSSSSSFTCGFCDYTFKGERGWINSICEECKEELADNITLTFTKEEIVGLINSFEGSDIINKIKGQEDNENS